MTQNHNNNSRDWVDTLTRWAGALGFNQIRVRWKLQRLQQKWSGYKRRAGQRANHVKYTHKICPHCGRINDRSESTCSGCEQPLGAHSMHVLNRIGLSIPRVVSVSSLLGAAMAIIYVRMIAFQGGGAMGSLWSFSVHTVYHFGGHWPPAVAEGEWWRLGTSIFLHIGIWHIAFNLFALSQIGPAVEEIFGRGRMVLFFMATGIVANLGSELFGLRAVSAGASGALMGLCGLAAGWGHRDGTSIGTEMRTLMLKWGFYTIVFGYFIGADNAAHVVGFVSGGLIGLVVRPDHLKKSPNIGIRVTMGVTGGAAAAAAAILAFFPPSSMLEKHFRVKRSAATAPSAPSFSELREICQIKKEGKEAEALARFTELYRKHYDPEWKPDPATMNTACGQLWEMDETCNRFRKGGLRAAYPDGTLPEDPAEQERIRRSLERLCTVVSE